jgi:hypothetical protein
VPIHGGSHLAAALALTATLTAEGIRTSSLQVIDPAKSLGEQS